MPSFLLTLSAVRISALVLLLYSIRVSKKNRSPRRILPKMQNLSIQNPANPYSCGSFVTALSSSCPSFHILGREYFMFS